MNFACDNATETALDFGDLPSFLCYWQSAGLAVFVVADAQAQPTPSVEPDQSDAGVDFSDWIVMRPTGAEAEFKAPGKPRYVERSFSPVQDQPPIKVRLYQSLIKEKNEMYIFGYHDLHFAPTEQEKNRRNPRRRRTRQLRKCFGKIDRSCQDSLRKIPGPGLRVPAIRSRKKSTRSVLEFSWWTIASFK